ncbi:hypothetical protein CSB11_01135 [Candidatus Campbellbacteria bacterium]|nr:MAG: hypothetical protein CSB11_01135 [Candidatus Campbellbacteria bacterium]
MNNENNNLTQNNSSEQTVTNYKDQRIIQIPLSIIKPNPYQPRLAFSDDKLSTLASSISQYGVLQPIVVSRKQNQDGSEFFEIIAGERRYRAAKIAGLQTIPAVLADEKIQNVDKFELAIIENIQREDLNPVDKAKAFKKLHEEFGLTHSQIAEKMGKSREYISNSIRLLDLPDKILEGIVKEEITEGHSKPLLILKERPFEQNILFQKIKDKKLTVRAANNLAKKLLSGEKEIVETGNSNNQYKIIEKKLSEKLGTKVSIAQKDQGEGGKLTIEFFSQEDLNKIVSLVRGKGLVGVDEALGGDIEKENQELKNDFSENLKTAETKNPAFFGDEIEKLDSQEKGQEKEQEVQGQKIEVEVENKVEQEQILASPKSAQKEVEESQKKETEENLNDLDGFNISSFLHKNEATKVQVQGSDEDFKKDLEEFKSIELEQNQEEQNEVQSQIQTPAFEGVDNFGDLKTETTTPTKPEKVDFTKSKQEITSFGPKPKIEVKEEQNVNQETKDDQNIDDIFSYSKPEPASVSKTPETKVNEFAKGDFMLNKEKLDDLEYEKNNQTVFGSQNQEKVNQILTQKFEENQKAKEKTFENQNLNQNVSEMPKANETKNEMKPSQNIENSSIYQEFLKSKEKIAEQQKRVFSGKKPAFSGETAGFMSSQGVINNENQTELKPEDYKDPVEETIEQMKHVVEEIDNSDEAILVNSGSDFIPKEALEKKQNQENQEIQKPKNLTEITPKNQKNLEQKNEDKNLQKGFGNFTL